jgi:hypothetical protein
MATEDVDMVPEPAGSSLPKTRKPRQPRQPRQPKTKKGDIKLQSRLEKYHTTDPTYTNCWIAYKKEKQELLAEDREEKKNRKDTVPKVDQIRGLLSKASRMAKWSDTLQDQGRGPQAEGARNESASALADACKLYRDGLSEDEEKELDDNEANCLAKGIAPEFPYLCSKSDLRDMEAQERSIKLSDMEKQISKYEQLLREEHGNLEASRALTQELIKQLEYSLPFIADDKQCNKLKMLLEQMK